MTAEIEKTPQQGPPVKRKYAPLPSPTPVNFESPKRQAQSQPQEQLNYFTPSCNAKAILLHSRRFTLPATPFKLCNMAKELDRGSSSSSSGVTTADSSMDSEVYVQTYFIFGFQYDILLIV